MQPASHETLPTAATASLRASRLTGAARRPRKASAAGWIRRWRKSFSPSQVMWIVSGAPWIWGLIADDGSPARYIHRSFQQYHWRRYGVSGRLLAFAGFVAGVPIVLALMARTTRARSAAVRRETGKGLLRQLQEQRLLWLENGVLPVSYYAFELYRDERRATALEYLYRLETKRGVYALLRERFSSAETTEALRSKAAFSLHCERHGVAAVPALFTVDKGKLTRLDVSSGRLPRCDLFLKPLSGSGGRGAAIWKYLGRDSYRNRDLGLLTEPELLEHLAALSREEPYVGRLYVRNHADIADLSPGALSSVRVVTCLDELYRPEPTHAVLRMARTASSIVDNFHAGGIGARVDLETGEIGAATDLGLNRTTQWWETHPVTGAQIHGRRIPMWGEVLDLVHRAHAAFADQIVVGWDVAILDDGPRLIEGNKSPDLDIVQRTSRAPVGNSRLGVLIAHHLHTALAADEAAPPLHWQRTVASKRSSPASPVTVDEDGRR